MALTSYLKVTGKSQGEIKGGCQHSGDKKRQYAYLSN